MIQVRNGRPGLLVEGTWVKDEDLYERFSIEKSETYGGSFLVDKETREVYTYLDNGKGLQKHHPFLSSLTPISTLSKDEYLKTLKKAHEFIRPEEAHLTEEERNQRNQKRTFILQYVTSRVPNGTSNFHQLIRNPKHPYLRLIVGKDNPEMSTHTGEVYEAGYGLKKGSLFPCITTQGRFQSPDPYEYTENEKIVTNIPITQEEAHKFYAFTQKYHLDSINLGSEIGFNFIHQNCSVYAREACQAANIAIPTQISLKDTIHRICPKLIKQVGAQFKSWTHQAASWWKVNRPRIIPQAVISFLNDTIEQIYAIFHRIADFFAACCLLPIRTALGEGFGEGGVAFRQLDKPSEHLTPPLKDWKNLFSLSRYKLNLPGIAQEWQLKQPSTVVYPHPTQLAIAP